MLKKTTLIVIIFLSQIANAYRIAPLLESLGEYRYKVATHSKRTQQYFNQGLLQFWDFQYTEAIRSFKSALNTDINCGMCYYMLGLSYGSNTNAPLSGGERFLALNSINQGLKRPVISVKSRELLLALLNRYYSGNKQTQKKFQLSPFHLANPSERESYLEAMRDVAKKYPKDREIQAQFAFALYDIDRQAHWKSNGRPKYYTQAALDKLDKIKSRTNPHPGIRHLFFNHFE